VSHASDMIADPTKACCRPRLKINAADFGFGGGL
jgi:hypothetical protein